MAAEGRHGPAARGHVASAVLVRGVGSCTCEERRERRRRARRRPVARASESDRLRHRKGRLAHPRAPRRECTWRSRVLCVMLMQLLLYTVQYGMLRVRVAKGAAQPEGVHGGVSGEQRARRAARRAREDRRRPPLRHPTHYGCAQMPMPSAQHLNFSRIHSN